jgi:hypothetical protein
MSHINAGVRGMCPMYGKAQFPSPAAANARRKQLKRKRNDPLEVFRCVHCKHWHLGHGGHREERRLERKQMAKRREPRRDWRKEIDL